jgi:hypothetical protein
MKHVVPCLQRDQYKGGYEVADLSTTVSHTTTDIHSILDQTFVMLEKSAESVFDILCEHIGISVDRRTQLLQQLKQKGPF